MRQAILAVSLLSLVVGFAARTASAIDACVHNSNGVLRIPRDGQCRPNEDAIQLAAPPAPTGISRAVHGSVGFGGATTGSGFSVEHTVNSGRFDVAFDTPFDVTPHCLVNAHFFAPCVRTSATTDGLTVECAFYIVHPPAVGGIAIEEVDQPFEFLCVQE